MNESYEKAASEDRTVVLRIWLSIARRKIQPLKQSHVLLTRLWVPNRVRSPGRQDCRVVPLAGGGGRDHSVGLSVWVGGFSASKYYQFREILVIARERQSVGKVEPQIPLE